MVAQSDILKALDIVGDIAYDSKKNKRLVFRMDRQNETVNGFSHELIYSPVFSIWKDGEVMFSSKDIYATLREYNTL